ncbi:ankyrin repeat-containing domain protein [Mycena galericulata]|nr:ankyrin repeat-containing domain protein [Mycena galericulata]
MSYTGAFFPGSKNFVITGSSLTSVTNHNTTVQTVLPGTISAERQQQWHTKFFDFIRIDALHYENMMEWMSPLNFFQRQADIFSNRQPGTGKWLLASPQFKDWESSQVGSVLWCRGIPGAGKTVLASLVVNYLMDRACDEKINVACVYMDHKETDIQTPQNLLGGFLRQLISKDSIPDKVQAFYKHHHDKKTKPTLEDLCIMLNSAIGQYSRVYFVVDALDEYPEESRSVLLRSLDRLWPPGNLMLTSRPNISIQPIFSNFQTLEIRASTDDITCYVNQQIASSSLSLRIKGRPDLYDEIHSKINSHAEGMHVFLLAKLHIDYLKTKLNVKAIRRALQDLPKGLNDTYNETMGRINDQSEDARHLAKLALMWVANVKRPLSVVELQAALAIEPESKILDADNVTDITTIISICAGLIAVDEAASVVRLIHYTTQDYLNSLPQFSHAQTTILSSCLTYLFYDEFQILPPLYNSDERENLFASHPFLDYAQYCLLHACGQPEHDLQDKIIIFLEQAKKWSEFWGSESSLNLQTIARNLLIEGMSSQAIKNCALCVASFRGHMQMVLLLLDRGANINTNEYETPLQAAASQGHKTVVQLLLKEGADINMRGQKYGTALQAAFREGHYTTVQLLIENGADVHTQHVQCGTVLQAASAEGLEAVVQLLIEKGVDINIKGGLYGSALQAASAKGHEAVVQLLIEKGGDVNIQGGLYSTALQAASFMNRKAVVQFLLNKGADVNMEGGHFGTALQAASSIGNKATVLMLIEKGANVNLQSGQYQTALQAASWKGSEAVVQLLLEMGANVDMQGGEFGTALEAAFAGNHKMVVQLLIDKGAGLSQQDKKYGTLLHAASAKGDIVTVMHLINMGVNVNMQKGEYGTALQAACAKGNKAIVLFLIEKGANVNTEEGKYGTALQAASWKGSEAIIWLLLEQGANVNLQGGRYATALQAASSQGHLAVAELLIEKGADINTLVQLLIENGANVNMHGGPYGTALLAASQWGHEVVVQLLIDNGADVNMKSGKCCNYRSALQIASAWGHKAIVQLLLENGAVDTYAHWTEDLSETKEGVQRTMKDLRSRLSTAYECLSSSRIADRLNQIKPWE